MIRFEHIGAVIPAYNAAAQIGDVLSQVLKWIPPNRVWVVDDGSSDGLVNAVMPHRVGFRRHPENRGKGEALKTGFRECLAAGTEAVFTLDADGQHDPSGIPDFLSVMNRTGCDAVVGMRPFRLKQMPPDRIFSNRTSSLITSLAAGRRIIDSQCGFRLYGKRLLEQVHPLTRRYEMETEMLILASKMGFTIAWCPVENRYSGQVSHIRRFRDTARFLKLISRFI
jgi:glycosyltransferase involved in cell wall biosynthesis